MTYTDETRRHDLMNYAMEILTKAGCDCYTYGGEQAKYLLKDLKTEYPNGMKFPYVDVANAILSISRPEPIVRAPWEMVWSTDDCTDGERYDSFEAARESALDTLIHWAVWERSRWGSEIPNEGEKESWNYMIYNFYTEVRKYDPDKDEYVEYWVPSYAEEKMIGWEEIK